MKFCDLPLKAVFEHGGIEQVKVRRPSDNRIVGMDSYGVFREIRDAAIVKISG